VSTGDPTRDAHDRARLLGFSVRRGSRARYADRLKDANRPIIQSRRLEF